jgi:hypothetical protein
MDYQIHGGTHTFNGDIEYLAAHGGVFFIYGNIGSMVQHGGVIYDHSQVKADRVQILLDRMSDQERERLNDQIRRLQDLLNRSNRECEHLRKKLNESGSDEPSDNVLVQRIDQLRSQLAKEREAHKRQIDELEWRLKAVTDIANGRNERLYEDENQGRKIVVPDNSFDVLFTLINEYPIHNDVDMAEELGISVSTVRYIAKVLRLAKSTEARREAKERLKRHGIEMIERRGGDQTKDKRQNKPNKQNSKK